MIRRFFTNQTNSITGAAILLGAASFVSRVVGLFRDRLFAHLFGAGDVLDAYYTAFRIPDLFYNFIIVGAISASFIPAFLAIRARSASAAWRFVNRLVTMIGLATTLLGVAGMMAAPALIHLAPDSSRKIALTVTLTRILFLSPLILGVSSIVGGVLQSYKNFLVYATAPIVYNVGIILGAVIFVPRYGLTGLAIGVILGALLHLAIQLPSLYGHGFRFRPTLALRDETIKKVGVHFLPRAMSLAMAELNIIGITFLASRLGSGSIAAFQFANNLMYLPVT